MTRAAVKVAKEQTKLTVPCACGCRRGVPMKAEGASGRTRRYFEPGCRMQALRNRKTIREAEQRRREEEARKAREAEELEEAQQAVREDAELRVLLRAYRVVFERREFTPRQILDVRIALNDVRESRQLGRGDVDPEIVLRWIGRPRQPWERWTDSWAAEEDESDEGLAGEEEE